LSVKEGEGEKGAPAAAGPIRALGRSGEEGMLGCGGWFPGAPPLFFLIFFFFKSFSKRAFEQEQLKQKQNNSTKTIILQHECTIKFTKLMINFIFYKNYLFTKLNAHKNT